MNYLFIRHLILKDVRHQRIRLMLIWLMAFLLPSTNLLQNAPLNDLVATFKVGIAILFFLLIVLTWVSAILLDPTCGSDRFLATRPISWTALLTSKALFVLLFLWVPIVIFRLLNVWADGVPLSFLDQAFYLFESALLFSAVASFFVLPALFFRRLTTVILTLVGCAFFCYIFSIFWSEMWSTFNLDSVFMLSAPVGGADIDPQLSFSLRVSSFLAVFAVLGLTMVPVGVLRTWKPAIAIPATVVFAGFFLSLVYAFYWPYQLDQFASDEPAIPRELPSPLRDQIHFTVENPKWDLSRNWKNNGNADEAKKNREFRLVQTMRFNGVTRPLMIWPRGGDVEVSLLSGKKLISQNGDSRGAYSSYNWNYDYFRKECAGIAPASPDYENSDYTESVTFYGHNPTGHRPDISDSELPGASIQGNATFGVARIKILKMTPLRAGARLNLTRRICEIRQIVPSERTVRILLNRSFVPLLLRGDLEHLPDYNDMNSLPFVVINRRTGEILDDNRGSEYFNPFDGLMLQGWTLSRALPAGAPKDQPPPPISRDWLDDADILLFRHRSFG